MFKLRRKIMDERTKFTVGAWAIVAFAFAAIFCLAVSLQGCAGRVWMEPDLRYQFNAFNASVADWDRRCQVDPNTCAESLSSMAEELAVWTAIVNGTDPNEVTR